MAQKKLLFDSAWKKVDDAQQKGLTQSALSQVKQIYATAKATNEPAQQIKALIYQARLTGRVDESNWIKSVDAFETEITTAKEPVRQLLSSILADLYENKFSTERYRIYSRTNTVNFKKDDPETWTARDFQQKISALYQSSLSNPALLKNTRLDAYQPVITKGNMEALRPTLFDLLAWKALEYFKSEERDVDKPANAFELSDQASLAAAPVFSRFTFESKDSGSLRLKAIQLYQEILAFHRNDADKSAFVDADISRLEFAHSVSVNEGKEALYKEALGGIFNSFKSTPEAAQAGFLLASWWNNKGNSYQAATGTAEDKNGIAIAVGILESVVALFPTSEGGTNAKNLLQSIRQQTLGLAVENVNVPGTPFRSLLSFKNLDKVHLRLVRITDELNKSLNDMERNSDDAYWTLFTQVPADKSWTQELPGQTDFRTHSAEIKVDALASGQYALIASANDQFTTGKNTLCVVQFSVSNISFVHSGFNYYILNRDDGQPLAGARVQVWYKNYDYNVRRYSRIKGELKTADRNGLVTLSAAPQNKSIALEITFNKDRLAPNDEMYINKSENYSGYGAIMANSKNLVKFEKDNARYFFFTDRSIYRPGQLVYFKAIGVTKDLQSLQSKLYLPGTLTEVELKDANYQKIASLQLQVSAYGAITGQFRLPENTLNGIFTLSINNSQAYQFSVEEYKRPKFSVSFEKVKDSYKVNEVVKVTGNAKAYAGNNIDGAAVKYRVYRQTRYLYPWIFWARGIWPPSGNAKQEMAHGETTTADDGHFDIQFTALPDQSVAKDLDPSFEYAVETSVTDLNGETRTATLTLQAGYKSLQLDISIPGGLTLQQDSLKSIGISVKNMNGEYQRVAGEIALYQLESPGKLLRKRYWPAPDTTVMDYPSFASFFPNDPYRSEDDYKTWKRGKMLLQDTFTSTENGVYLLKNASFETGWYLVEAEVKDKDGQPVKNIGYVALYNAVKQALPSPEYDWNLTLNSQGQPGQTASFLQGTNAGPLFVVEETIKHFPGSTNDSSLLRYISINNGIAPANFSITEADRGNFAVNRFFVKHNRFYSNQWLITVPWENKELDISYETFRDQLLPGARETWKVKIKGYKGEKVAAEMVTSMYDASLDQFKPHNWDQPSIWPQYYFYNRWQGETNFRQEDGRVRYKEMEGTPGYDKRYDALTTVADKQQGLYYANLDNVQGVRIRGRATMAAPAPGQADEIVISATRSPTRSLKTGEKIGDSAPPKVEGAPAASPDDLSAIAVRSNLQETAFFFPELHTDTAGNVEFSFTMPEALTKWKIQTFAHTTDLAMGLLSASTVTQKELMVQPNAPRFFREGDKLQLSTKVVNLTAGSLNGQVQLFLFDAATNKPVDGLFKNSIGLQNFTAGAGLSTLVKFPIEIPVNYPGALSYRIVARSGAVSDGEETAAPVLSNRMLVTESLPINIRNTNSKNFTFDALLNSAKSNTASPQALTVEFTSNPAWYAVQALPYLMEYPYECVEQNFNRFYANALAAKVVNSMPRIKAVFETWKTQDTAALLSNLEKNADLKQALLEETPWVMDAQNESKQKRQVALLFDLVKMSAEAARALNKVKQSQVSNGGFTWFKGGPDDRYMTQYILASMGHLIKLGAWPAAQPQELTAILQKALPYLDARIKQDYDELVRNKVDLTKNQLSSLAIHWLYMRSFFTAYPVAPASQKAVEYFTAQAKQYWLQNSRYQQGMIALALWRKSDTNTPRAILKSLKENSIQSEEFGMYWKEFNTGGYYWYQAPVESHSLLIEAFSEIENNMNTINDLKTWLLKQKQTQNWRSTKATAEACYALLLQGSNWLETERMVDIQLGDYHIRSNDAKVKAEAGTGYFKQKISAGEIKPAMGKISVSLKQPGTTGSTQSFPPAWGAVYYQYFEELDKIKEAATPLALVKKLFIEKNTDRGPVLEPVTATYKLKIGDKIKVRIELRVDRSMEYVHMKDMRAACLEPVNVISQYKYQDGLGYYESTKDASTNFFFNYLNRGTYVFEYPLTVTHSGNFSNGVTSIQCMYAPEFTSHSEGVRIGVE